MTDKPINEIKIQRKLQEARQNFRKLFFENFSDNMPWIQDIDIIYNYNSTWDFLDLVYVIKILLNNGDIKKISMVSDTMNPSIGEKEILSEDFFQSFWPVEFLINKAIRHKKRFEDNSNDR